MKKIIAIDAGNTALKIGEFQESELKAVKRMALSELLRQLKPAIADSNLSIVVSSVLKSEDLELLTEIIPTAIILNPTCILPFNNQYATPSTLGMDRLCNAGYAYKFMGTDYAVVIDLGTCLKFDLVHYQQGYLGGSISPGIDLRYRSLNEHTGNLPLISNKSKTNLVGNNTEESIRSGVMNGIHA